MKETDMSYQNGRYEAIMDMQSFLIESARNRGVGKVYDSVGIYNDLVQYLHMENSRWMSGRIATVLGQSVEGGNEHE